MTSTGIERSCSWYLHLLWPERQSGAAVEHNDVILGTYHTNFRFTKLTTHSAHSYKSCLFQYSQSSLILIHLGWIFRQFAIGFWCLFIFLVIYASKFLLLIFLTIIRVSTLYWSFIYDIIPCNLDIQIVRNNCNSKGYWLMFSQAILFFDI